MFAVLNVLNFVYKLIGIKLGRSYLLIWKNVVSLYTEMFNIGIDFNNSEPKRAINFTAEVVLFTFTCSEIATNIKNVVSALTYKLPIHKLSSDCQQKVSKYCV